MGMQSKTCPKCGGRMDQGFLLEFTDSNIVKPTLWIEGAVEKNWYGSVKRKGKDEYVVESYRCGRCHYVENYAPPKQDR